MNDLFKMVLSLSVSGSVLMAVILLIRRIWGGRLSKQWQYYAWLLVVVRLLCPFSPEQTITNRLFTEKTPVAAPIVQIFPDKAMEAPLTAPSVSAQTEVPDKQAWLSRVWILWCLGTAVLLVQKLTIYQRFAFYIKREQTKVTDNAFIKRFWQLAEQIGISRKVGFYTNSLVSTPLLMGVIRPCVILPSTELTESEFEHTILHELTHLKRRDILYKWLVQITICIHWFNPLVWFLGREVSRACELSCDEAVIRQLTRDSQFSYGDTLLHAAYTEPRYHSSLAAVTLFESKKLLKERLDAIVNYKKQSGSIILLTILLTLTAAFTATATGAYIPEKASSLKRLNESGDMKYKQASYYQAPYIFELGWNIDSNASSQYVKGSFPLEGNTSLSVAFDDECLSYLEDQAVLEALTHLLNRLSTQYAIITPLVKSIKNVSGQSITELAEQFYKDEDMVGLSAMIPELDIEMQKDYIDKIFENSQISFLAAILPRLTFNMVNTCTRKAYEEDNISFFTLSASHLLRRQRSTWTHRAISDNRLNFSAALSDYVPNPDEDSFTDTEQDFPVYQPDSSGKIIIPVSIASMTPESVICLGRLPDLQNAISISYDVEADNSGGIAIGICSEKPRNDGPLWFYYTVSAHGNVRELVHEDLYGISFEEDYNGFYRVYLLNAKDSLSNITGTVTIEYKK